MAAGPGDHQRVLPQGDRQGKQQKRDHGKHNDADLYGLALSNGTLSAVTDMPELQARRERHLEAVYPIVWLDAIHYKENEKYVASKNQKALHGRSEVRLQGAVLSP